MKNDMKQLNDRIATACVKSCQKVLTQIANTKDAILSQFRDLVADHEQVLRLALNEAEALAWETRYPQLVFPDLAEEKAQSIVNWISHQRSLTAGRVEA